MTRLMTYTRMFHAPNSAVEPGGMARLSTNHNPVDRRVTMLYNKGVKAFIDRSTQVVALAFFCYYTRLGWGSVRSTVLDIGYTTVQRC